MMTEKMLGYLIKQMSEQPIEITLTRGKSTVAFEIILTQIKKKEKVGVLEKNLEVPDDIDIKRMSNEELLQVYNKLHSEFFEYGKLTDKSHRLHELLVEIKREMTKREE